MSITRLAGCSVDNIFLFFAVARIVDRRVDTLTDTAVAFI